MKAASYTRTGAAREVLQRGDLPESEPGPGEVRVRLHWSGFNPSDVKSRADLRGRGMPFPRVTPHSDGAGVIEAVGAGVPVERLGRRVWVWNAAWGRPDGTAAVGHYAVQFARLLGARQVIASVSSAHKAQVALEAGAHATVNYRAEPLAALVAELTAGEGLDRVIEVDIAANGVQDAEMLKPGGCAVVYGSGQAGFELTFFPLIVKNLSWHFFIVYALSPADRAAAEAALRGMLEDGLLQHPIARRVDLADIVAAHEAVESGQLVGNLVVRPPAAQDR